MYIAMSRQLGKNYGGGGGGGGEKERDRVRKDSINNIQPGELRIILYKIRI